jgi:hypothetical protein
MTPGAGPMSIARLSDVSAGIAANGAEKPMPATTGPTSWELCFLPAGLVVGSFRI